MAERPIKYPGKGLSDNYANAEQLPGTTPEEQNMRVQDPVTKRLQGAQRSGLQKYVSTLVDAGGAKVDDINAVVRSQKTVDYAEIDDGSLTEAWSNRTPSNQTCRNVKRDRQDNVYALDGDASLVKFNSEGTEVWRFDFPVEDQDHIVRALYVDDLDCVYAGVSEGGDQSTARVWKFAPDEEFKLVKIWEIEPGGYIEEVTVREDRIVLAVNFADEARSTVRIYEGVAAINPTFIQDFNNVPYPINAMHVREDDGAVFTASEAFGTDTTTFLRGPSPKYPEFSPRSVDWTPEKDLTDYDDRVWAHYKPEASAEIDGLEENDDVLIFRDVSGNRRHFYIDLTHNKAAPKYSANGINGLPSIRFEGGQGMETLVNFSLKEADGDRQKTAVPMHDEAAWCMFMVVRPAQLENGASPANVPQAIFFQQDAGSGTSGTANDHIIWSNRQAGDDNPGSIGAGDVGKISWEMKTNATDPGDGAGTQTALEGSFDTDTQTVLLTMLHDADVDNSNGGTPGTGATRSLFRIDGNPIDRWSGIESASRRATRLGSVSGEEDLAHAPGTTQGSDHDFTGDIAEILVLRYRPDEDSQPNLILTHDKFGSDPGVNDAATGNQSVNEMTQIEGYLMHKYGIQKQAPGSGDTYPHPFGLDSNSEFGPPSPDGGVSDNVKETTLRYPILCKYTAQGELKWVYNQNTQSDTGANRGGVGYGVITDSEGDVYSMGPDATNVSPSGDVAVRKITDEDDSFSEAWRYSYPSNAEPNYQYPRMGMDKFDNVYVPYSALGNARTLTVLDSDGTEKAIFDSDEGVQAYAVAPGLSPESYGGDAVTIAEKAFFATEFGGDVLPGVNGHATVYRVDLVSTTVNSNDPRILTYLAVSNGDIRKFTTSTVTTPTGGGSALSTSRYVNSAVFLEDVFYTDGDAYKVYKGADDEVSDWESTSAGKIPERQRLIAPWAGRIVLARGADDPQNWHMSAIDNPYDWDQFPPNQNPAQAVSGNNVIAPGAIPDIINALIPFTEDFLIFGGDHTIFRLTGNPVDGGRIDLVSDSTGMAFGKSWCKDPEGKVYFFGSRGGLYMMPNPVSQPVRLTQNTIEDRLHQIDFATYRVELVWNTEDDGVHIFQMPYGSGGTIVKHWFWEQRTGAIHEDVFGATTVQPTAAFVLDGDDIADRVLLLGGEDSYIRKWVASAKDDDGNAIDSYVTIGPLGNPNDSREQRYTQPKVWLSENSDGATYQLLVADSADATRKVVASGDLKGGQNARKAARARGAVCYLRMRNSKLNQSWAYERGFIRQFSAGRSRSRT